jgi:hypothetical protein
MSVSVSTTAGNQVTVTVDGATQLSFTTEESSISVVNGDTSSISVTNQGPKGDTGIQGPQGPAGADGEGVIAGGTANEFLQKNSATDYDTKWSAYTLPAADGADGQVLTTDGAGTVSFAFPKTIAEDVKNVSGGQLSKGTPVHVTGSVGNLAEVIAADAATNYPAHFVLDEDLPDEGEGKGIALGFINNVDVPDASIYTEGQTVYLGASGGWTTTKPTGANAIQNLGVLIKVNTSGNKVSGIIMGAGRANDVPNIPYRQAWIGNALGVATPTTLATVATSGSYNDLSDQPTIPTDTNLGNSDQTLSAERTVEMSANAIVFENSSTEVARIFPQGYIRLTGRNIINGNGSIGGQVVLNDSDNSNNVTIQGPSTVGSNLTLTLPDADGSSGEVLKTNGSGVLSFGQAVSRGGTYSWSGYATDVTKTSSFYYQFPSATATSSSMDMISSSVAQAKAQATYGANGAMVLDGLSSTDSATYSMTVKITTNTTVGIQTLAPAGGQFVPAVAFAFSNPGEQTFTLTQTSPTACLEQATNPWNLGLSITFFAAGSIDFRVEDLSITVS